jgi:type IV pilus assembly protein PilC
VASNKFTIDDIIIIIDVFKTSIRDGLDIKFILEELHDMFDQTKKASTIKDMGQRIFAGGMIHEGFRGMLPDSVVEAIGFAHEKGHLDNALEEIQKTYELKQSLAQQLRKAIAYPLVVVGLFMVMGIAALLFLMPMIEGAFRGMDPEKIPEINKTLFAISHAMREHFVLLIVFIAFACLIIYSLAKKYSNKILFKLPVIKDIMQFQESAMSFQMLRVFFKAGVNIQKAFSSIAVSLSGNFRNVFIDTAAMLSDGKTITDAFEKNKVDKKYVIRVKAGELTGSLDDAFGKISALEQRAMEKHMSILTKTVNAVMLLLAGTFALGFYAITVLPVYNMALG